MIEIILMSKSAIFKFNDVLSLNIYTLNYSIAINTSFSNCVS